MEYSLTDNRYWAEGLFNDVIGRPLHLGEGARVALKKVLATSSPERIQNELMILEYLRSVPKSGAGSCGPLTRPEDQSSLPS